MNTHFRPHRYVFGVLETLLLKIYKTHKIFIFMTKPQIMLNKQIDLKFCSVNTQNYQLMHRGGKKFGSFKPKRSRDGDNVELDELCKYSAPVLLLQFRNAYADLSRLVAYSMYNSSANI